MEEIKREEEKHMESNWKIAIQGGGEDDKMMRKILSSFLFLSLPQEKERTNSSDQKGSIKMEEDSNRERKKSIDSMKW